jgi:RNA polymerase sigma-70 factor (ECF subfamily)
MAVPAHAPADPRADGRSDGELMDAYRSGDARAFEVLVVRHQRGLYNFIFRSVHDPARADELLQEVFLRVVRSRDRWKATAQFSTWAYSIARNLCVDESRRMHFRRHRSLDAPMRGKNGEDGATFLSRMPAEQVPTDEAAQAPGLRERIAEAIDLLPLEQREVFLMRQMSGLSFKEIGEVVGVPENTAKSRMRYALDRLRQELEDLKEEPEAAESQPSAHEEREHG